MHFFHCLFCKTSQSLFQPRISEKVEFQWSDNNYLDSVINGWVANRRFKVAQNKCEKLKPDSYDLLHCKNFKHLQSSKTLKDKACNISQKAATASKNNFKIEHYNRSHIVSWKSSVFSEIKETPEQFILNSWMMTKLKFTQIGMLNIFDCSIDTIS